MIKSYPEAGEISRPRFMVSGEDKGKGRSKLTLVEVVNKDVRTMNVTEHMALDNVEWRNRICG